MKKAITQNEKYQLIGLLTLAQKHYQMISLLTTAMSKIIDEDDSILHDAIYDGDADIDNMLKVMDIEVTK